MTIPRSISTPKTIVLIHGLWMTPLCWEHWVERYERRGFRVLAPAWPGMDATVEQLRRDPAPIASQRVAIILDHYEGIIRGLDQPPIILGHSFGGAFVQVLLNRGLGSAGVAIHSATVRGVLDLPLTTLRCGLPLLRNPLNRHRAIGLTPVQFHYAFTNTLTPEASLRAWERYHVPGARNILLEGAFANFNRRTALRVDFDRNDRAPLLFIAGSSDHVVPASSNRSNVDKYRTTSAATDYREYPGRSHFTLGQDGWEAVADDALDWAVGRAQRAAGPRTSVMGTDRVIVAAD